MSAKGEGRGRGRIDLLGGVADYSGSLVLQVATQCETCVVMRVDAAPTADDADVAHLSTERFAPVTVPLAALRSMVAAAPSGGAVTPAALREVRAHLTACGAAPWAGYVFGALAAFALETGWLPPPGASVHLDVSSRVPLAQGVSSSASIEVATLRAVSSASGRALEPLRLAHVAQGVENYVVGAPCGLMDQLASALGTPGRVLPILCRPDACEAPVPLPAGVVVVGWPSGVQHSVAASPYLTARTGAFMAKRALESAPGVAHLRRLAHITELTPSELLARAESLPASITGAAFVSAYGGVDDGLSRVEPTETYDLRASARFPIEENFRCSLALTLLRSLALVPADSPAAETALSQIGELMRQSHRGYSAIGLGCPELDTMLHALTHDLGVAAGVYGARVSGGGSGGTVAILCRADAIPAIEALAHQLTFGAPFPGLIL